jgi:hypothetical protein
MPMGYQENFAQSRDALVVSSSTLNSEARRVQRAKALISADSALIGLAIALIYVDVMDHSEYEKSEETYW